MQKIHSFYWDRIKIVKLWFQWLSLEGDFQKTTNTSIIPLVRHSIMPLLPSLSLETTNTRATKEATSIILLHLMHHNWPIYHQLKEKEKTVEDAISKLGIHMWSFAPLSLLELWENSSSLFTSTKPWETWPSRGCSIQWTRAWAKSRSCLTSSLRKLRSFRAQLQSGRFSSWRSHLSTWWLMRMVVQCHNPMMKKCLQNLGHKSTWPRHLRQSQTSTWVQTQDHHLPSRLHCPDQNKSQWL